MVSVVCAKNKCYAIIKLVNLCGNDEYIPETMSTDVIICGFAALKASSGKVEKVQYLNLASVGSTPAPEPTRPS